MGLCFVPLCNHRSERDGCSMYSFPRTPKRLAKWKRLIRRGDTSPRHTSRICSCHFTEDRKEPSRFAWNIKKCASPKKASPKKKCRGVTARKLTFDHSPTEEMPCQGIGENVLDEGRKGKEVERDSPLLSEGVKDGEIEKETMDVAVGTEEQEFDHQPMLKKRMSDLEEENERLHSRIKELEAKLVLSTSALHEAENYLLHAKVKKLEEELSASRDVLSFKKISRDKALVMHYTGLPNKETFHVLLSLFDEMEIQYQKGWKVTRLNNEDQLFLTLLKLRRNLTITDLGARFNISRPSVANIFISWVMALHHVIFVNLMKSVPSREKNQTDLPECFSEYPNTRIILDCTEITSAIPALLSDQNRMYSNYKGRITSKALVGILPNGTVAFVSDLFAGSTSDRKIVEESGILNCLVPGDAIMADKGFNITDLMPDGVGLNIPPFKHTPQFTPEEIDETVAIAAARIHVERAISRIKRFAILDFIPQFVLPYASEIFQVCSALTNFKRRLISDHGSDDE